MATPYKRVKLTHAISGEFGDHKEGTTIDLPSAVAEVLINQNKAKLLGAGSPPADHAARADTKAKPKPGE